MSLKKNLTKQHHKHKHEDVAIANINSKLMSQLNTPPVYQFPTIKLKIADDLKEYKGPHEEKNIKEWIDRVISLSSPKFKTVPRIPQIKSPESPVRSLSSSFMQELEPIIGKTIRISSKTYDTQNTQTSSSSSPPSSTTHTLNQDGIAQEVKKLHDVKK